MLKAFKYELNPNTEQIDMLNKHFGCSRYVYNWGLERKAKAYKQDNEKITCFDLIKEVTQLKKSEEFVWLKEVHSQTLQMSLRNLDNAFTNFFSKKAKFPTFKSKHRHQSFQYPQGVKLNDNKIYLPKIGWVHFGKSREIIGDIKTVTVSKTPTNRYYVSILCDTKLSKPAKKEVKSSTAVGIDLGIKVFAYTSDGQMFENQKHLLKALKKLRIAQRSLSRKQKGSKRREQQRLVVAKLHQDVVNKRKDWLHKLSTSLVLNYDTICIEDLNVSGMMRNRKLSRHIQDVGWRSFRAMLEYKVDWYGKNLITIGRFAPSSKMCNHCGAINSELKLSHREWTCNNCQRTVERDFNAALNIKDFGLGTKPVAS